MNPIEEKGIKFLNKIIDGKVRKIAISSIKDPDIAFVSQFKDISTMDRIISNIDMALNGEFALIDDPDLSTNLDIAFITPTRIDFYDKEGENVVGTLTLQEFKDLMVAWKTFFSQSPFDGDFVA